VARLLRVGNRMIDLDAVVAAEERGGVVEIYISGIGNSFRFEGEHARSVWRALGARADEQGAATGASEFSVVEMPGDEADAGASAAPPAATPPPAHRGPGVTHDPLVDAVLTDATPRRFVRSTPADPFLR